MNVNFELIRYANCWEDADILLKGLNVNAGSKVLSIASAGDNSFSLLTADPEEVTAVDISNVQLYLVELKKTAIIHLSQEEFIAFIGIEHSGQRKQQYQLLRTSLGSEARAYWDKNIHIIETGLVNAGKFEKYFSIFRKWMLPLIHSKNEIRELFREKTQEEQSAFYHKTWNNRRWKFLFALFFNKYVMGKYGRDPEFLKQVNVTVHDFIYTKAENHLSSVPVQDNYFLEMILLGRFETALPHYLRPENYNKIRENINRFKIKQGFVQELLTTEHQHFNLSNIFEYMPMEIFRSCVQHFNEKSPQGSSFAYWNLMVPRRLSVTFPDRYIYDNDSKNLSTIDKGFFYDQFIIDRKIK